MNLLLRQEGRVPTFFTLSAKMVRNRAKSNSKRKEKRRKNDGSCSKITPKRNKPEEEQNSQGEVSKSDEVSTQQEDHGNQLRRSARRALLDNFSDETSKNNNATMGGSIFVPKNSKFSDNQSRKSIEQIAFERKQKLNLDSEVDLDDQAAILKTNPSDKNKKHLNDVSNGEFQKSDNQKKRKLKPESEIESKRNKFKLLGVDEDEIVVNEMLQQVMPDDSFRMEVDPGDELDYSFENEVSDDDNDQQDSSEVSEEECDSPGEKTDENNNDIVDEYERLKDLPDVKKFIQLLNGQKEGSENKSKNLDVVERDHGEKGAIGGRGKTMVGKAPGRKGRVSVGKQKRKVSGKNKVCDSQGDRPITIVKSPSDTTIYAPALKQKRFGHNLTPTIVRQVTTGVDSSDINSGINQIRLNNYPGDQPGTSGRGDIGDAEYDRRSYQQSIERQQNKACDIAEQMVVRAERQKAAIEAPAGENMLIANIYDINESITDKIKEKSRVLKVPEVDILFNDDNPQNYTQVSAHIDEVQANKIKVGGFIEIEKLQQRPRDFRSNSMNQGVELVVQDGRTYFIPSKDKDLQKINCFAKWEQAFRVYASIYTQANPHQET